MIAKVSHQTIEKNTGYKEIFSFSSILFSLLVGSRPGRTVICFLSLAGVGLRLRLEAGVRVDLLGPGMTACWWPPSVGRASSVWLELWGNSQVVQVTACLAETPQEPR